MPTTSCFSSFSLPSRASRSARVVCHSASSCKATRTAPSSLRTTERLKHYYCGGDDDDDDDGNDCGGGHDEETRAMLIMLSAP